MRFYLTHNDGGPISSHTQDTLSLEDDEMIVFCGNIAQSFVNCKHYLIFVLIIHNTN